LAYSTPVDEFGRGLVYEHPSRSLIFQIYHLIDVVNEKRSLVFSND